MPVLFQKRRRRHLQKRTKNKKGNNNPYSDAHQSRSNHQIHQKPTISSRTATRRPASERDSRKETQCRKPFPRYPIPSLNCRFAFKITHYNAKKHSKRNDAETKSQKTPPASQTKEQPSYICFNATAHSHTFGDSKLEKYTIQHRPKKESIFIAFSMPKLLPCSWYYQ